MKLSARLLASGHLSIAFPKIDSIEANTKSNICKNKQPLAKLHFPKRLIAQSASSRLEHHCFQHAFARGSSALNINPTNIESMYLMTTANTNLQLTISIDTGSEPQSANMRIELGQASISLPLPGGLSFEGESPLSISLSFPNQYSHNQETHDASVTSKTAIIEEASHTHASENKTDKKQLLLSSPCSPQAASKYQTQWPVIGGEYLTLDTADILNSKTFAEKFSPGITRDIYIAGCPGLKDLKKQLSIPIFKVGECGEGRIADRIKQQSKDKYGSYYKIDGDWPVQDEGYDEYSALQIYLPETLHEKSPVRALTRGLSVTLPKGMSRQQFSHGFQKKLASCSWLVWRNTEDAIAHFERKNINQDVIDRYTDYGLGGGDGINQATEFYCIRNENSDDCKRLIAVIENVILEHMGLI